MADFHSENPPFFMFQILFQPLLFHVFDKIKKIIINQMGDICPKSVNFLKIFYDNKDRER